MKRKPSRLLSVILAVLMLITVCISPTIVGTSADDNSSVNNVVYVKTTNAGPFGQQVTVSAGKTYVFTYSISNDLAATVAVNDSSARYQSLLSSVTAAEISKDTTTSDKYTTYTYELTFADTFTKSSAIIGLKFSGTKPYTGYVFDFSVYDKADMQKTEMLSNNDFAEGYLDGWVYKYMTFSAGKNALGLTSSTFEAENGTVIDTGETYLEVMAFEDTDMYEVEIKAQMLYFNVNDRGPIQQRVSVEAGKSYTYTFSLSESVTEADITVGAYHVDNRTSSIATGTKVSSVDEGGYVVYTYQITMPDTMTDKNGDATTSTFVGIRFTGTLPAEGYLFNASLYKTDDTAKTEMLEYGSFNGGYLDKWTWGYTDFRSGERLGLTEYTSTDEKVNLQVVDFDESLMPDTTPKPEPDVPDGTPKMLYFKSSGKGPLYQRVENLTPNGSYKLSFALSNNVNNFEVVAHKNGGRAQITIQSSLVSAENKGDYTIYSYNVTMPSEITVENGNETNMAFIGIRFNNQENEGYIFDLSLTDSNGNEMYLNGDFAEGYLDRWAWGWNKWFNSTAYGISSGTWSHATEGEVYLEVMAFDEALLSREKTMFFIDDAKTSGGESLVLRAKALEPNVEYTVSFDYKFISGALNQTVYYGVYGGVNEPGSLKTLNKQLYSSREVNENLFTTVTDDGKNVKYTFTLTEELIAENTYFYAGFRFLPDPIMKTKLYVANMTLYKSEDSLKTNLFYSDEYETKVDNWFSNYGESSLGSDAFGRGDVEFTAKYLPYNAEYFETPTDIHYGDIDYNGKINILDLVSIDQMITQNSNYFENADANGNSFVEQEDINSVKKHMIGVSTIEWVEKGHGLMEAGGFSGGADAEAQALKAQISSAADTLTKASSTNKIYYVAQNGNDSNNGLSQSKPITANKINSLSLSSGDLVLFKRGDVFRLSEEISPVDGVSYGAYGSGAKPKIFGSLKNYADESLWTTTDNRMWKVYLGTDTASQIVFNGGEWVGFSKDTLDEVNFNGDFYYDTTAKTLYLYLNQINPAKYFDSIEIATTDRAFNKYGSTSDTVNNITFENLDIRYFTLFGFNLYFTESVEITNCEIGWIGGDRGGSGSRYGNAIQLWRHSNNTSVSNNYIYQIFDAAITFQGSTDNDYTNLTFKNNLIEYCSMNFEFWGRDDSDRTSTSPDPDATMHNIAFEDNILRFAGYGFGGKQRKTQPNQAFVLAWNNSYDEGQIESFTIKNNIFDVANCYFYYGTETFADVDISANTYYQMAGSCFTVVKGQKVYGDDLTVFTSEIKTVDSAPKEIGWVY